MLGISGELGSEPWACLECCLSSAPVSPGLLAQLFLQHYDFLPALSLALGWELKVCFKLYINTVCCTQLPSITVAF